MHLKSLAVKNFRALEDIEVEFDNRVNVIVGPNAIGKTTVLDAVRLTKALLAPRTQSEAVQALISVGAVSPHSPQSLNPEALARDVQRNIEIKCRFAVTDDELGWLRKSTGRIATQVMQAQMGQAFANPSAFTSFISSNQGRAQLTAQEGQIAQSIQSISSGDKSIRLDMTMDIKASRISGGDPVMPTLFAALDQRQSPDRTIFSYFPADRALPLGEPPVQIGAADAGNQLEAHNSQPQLKYARLKNTIFSTVIMSDSGREELKTAFQRIFSGILRGRSLVGVGLNEFGLLSIKVEDTESKRIFDLDGMSSGEKGLILTFLLVERSMANDGLILLDEPELHLNPAVCKDLLRFLVEGYSRRKNLQAIVCSHSPEILAGAFDQDECSLFHLESPTMLTKVRRQDFDVVSDALRRLGTSEGEGLLFQATVFVEGEDDVELLEAGFGDLLRRYKLKDLGGRREVEKEITKLQEAENAGAKLSSRYFIFDRDEAPTTISSSKAVKVLQWSVRCLENYLIDIDKITDLLKREDVLRTPVATHGEVSKLLKTLALQQLDELTAKKVYASYGYESPGLRASEVVGKSTMEIADILSARLTHVVSQLGAIDEASWKSTFIEACAKERKELETLWETKWKEDCDGKRLFRDLHRSLPFRVSLPKFKKILMSEMRVATTDNWRVVESQLKGLISVNTPNKP